MRNIPDDQSQIVLFVPKSEVEAFFSHIRTQTGIQLSFPDPLKCPGFDLVFDLDGIPRLRYLGRYDKNTSTVELLDRLGDRSMALNGTDELDSVSLPTFRQKLQAAVTASKPVNKANTVKKRQARIELKRKWCAELRRSQCYFGARPRVPAGIGEMTNNPNLTWGESQELSKRVDHALGIGLPKLDITHPVPYSFHADVVFICFDIEWWEHNPRKLTEFGFATLDTRDLVGVPPGAGATQWMKRIRCRHFRVAENSHLENKTYVTGCSDKFIPEFGITEWISTHEMFQAVASCFRPPYSTKGLYSPYPPHKSQVPPLGSNIEPLVDQATEPKRNIVLVGHDIKSDVQKLKKAGYNIENLSNVVEAIDTANIHRTWKRTNSIAKLGKVLLDLDIDGWYLHNAVSRSTRLENCC